MDQIEKIFALMEPLAQERFERSQGLIEEYCEKFVDEIAVEINSAFKSAFRQTANLQKETEKSASQFLMMSHLYSSIRTGGYSVKIDIFDKHFYADPFEIDAYLKLDWLYGFFADDMNCFKKAISKYIPRIREFELEQISYRYIYYYHAVALKLISENIPSLLHMPEFLVMEVEQEFEVLFGGYMDKAVVVWPIAEGMNEVFFA